MPSALERAPKPEPGFFASSIEGVRNAVTPPATKADWARFLVVLAELVLVALVVDRYQIESRAFGTLVQVAIVGFAVHALLPARFRLTFFALLSLAGIFFVLGPKHTPWVVAMGLGLIGIAHLPVSLGIRVPLLVAVAAALIVMRVDVWNAPFSAAVWPVLGSMFMFRLLIFIYDRHHGQKPRSIWETLSYFFLLPNVCFPLFPVIDYSGFKRSWYGEEAWTCYQTGVRWLVRGLVQLLMYRFVYYYGVIAPEEVADAGDLVRYLVTNFGLYLRVSGIFHIAIGLLRLFGFALPESHFLYYLSSSVNDFWRRINIYWKDFMLKFSYLPAFFKLRKKGESRALVLSTLWVVLVTWVLHSWQWFWLRGSFPIHWQDGAFWFVLGGFMIWNTLAENRKAGARGRHARTWTARNFLGQSARIAGIYALMSVLWSLWTCGSWDGWVGMMTMQGTGPTPSDTTLAAGSMTLGLLVLVMGTEYLAGKHEISAPFTARNAGMTTLSLALLTVISFPAVYTSLGDETSANVQSLRVSKLNRLDSTNLQRGYYEDLLDVNRFNEELWRAWKAKPADWLQLHETLAVRLTGNYLVTELVSSSETVYKGALLRTNQWGMRDRDYTLEKPDGTYRIALLGASYVMGSGVENEQTFEALVEDRLTAEGPGVPERRYEIMNHSVGGYSPLQKLWMLEERAVDFSPDMVMFVAHENELYRQVRHMDAARKRDIEPPYQKVQEIYSEKGVSSAMAADVFLATITPHEKEILAWTFQRIVHSSLEMGARPVFVFLPTLEMHGAPEEIAWMVDLAREAGFEMIELFDVYDGQDIFSIRVAPWDYHPNASGHALIADHLYEALSERL